MKTNRMLPDFSIKKIWERLKELSTSISNCLPLTGGTVTGNLRVAHWVTIDTGDDGWQAYEFVNGDGKSRGGIQMGADNAIVFYQHHANTSYAEKYCLPIPDSNLSAEVWYRMYSTKNVIASFSDITAGSSYLTTDFLYIVCS